MTAATIAATPAETTAADELDDLLWLEDMHGVDIFTSEYGSKRAAVAVLYGNEDCPVKVEVYAENDYRANPIRTYSIDNDTGNLVLVS